MELIVSMLADYTGVYPPDNPAWFAIKLFLAIAAIIAFWQSSYWLLKKLSSWLYDRAERKRLRTARVHGKRPLWARIWGRIKFRKITAKEEKWPGRRRLPG